MINGEIMSAGFNGNQLADQRGCRSVSRNVIAANPAGAIKSIREED